MLLDFSWAIGLVAIGFVGGATLDRIRLAVVLQDLMYIHTSRGNDHADSRMAPMAFHWYRP